MVKTKGFTIYICVGPWARPRISRDGPTLRVCLGFVAVGFIARDLECFMANVDTLLERSDVRESAAVS